MAADMDRRAFLRVPGGLAVAGALGLGGATLFDVTAASAALQPLGTVSIPKIKVNKTIYAGIASDALAKGVGHGSWSADPGTAGHTQLFGHRTAHGGVFRNLHKLRAGDSIVVNGVTYRVRRIDILPTTEKKKIWAYEGDGTRLSLVACSKANGLPTSSAYRICVRANA